MKKTSKLWFAASLFLLGAAATSASAAGSGAGLISNVTVQNGIALFTPSGTHASEPTCATSGHWAFVANTASGQAMLATLLTAYGLGKSITVVGDGTCSAWRDSETVSYLISP